MKYIQNAALWLALVALITYILLGFLT